MGREGRGGRRKEKGWKFVPPPRNYAYANDQVTQFRYLGSLITEDGYCEKQIRSRIGMAKKIFQDNKKLFIGKMNLELKKRIIKMLGVECSTLCCRNVDINPSG